MNNRSKKLLADVLAACEEIAGFIDGKVAADYLRLPLLRRGVERDLEIIGEALHQLRSGDPATFALIPDGAQIIAMRHRLIHAYGDVNDLIVWDVALHEVPALSTVVRHLLDAGD